MRYATGVDTRDWELLRSCFADDCPVDYGTLPDGTQGGWDAGRVEDRQSALHQRPREARRGLTRHQALGTVMTIVSPAHGT